MKPAISVVTPTHDRRNSVLRLLRALEAGGIPPEQLEVVVVADGCSDDTVTAIRGDRFAFPVHVLEQMPGRGSAAARNLGAAQARGELLVFLDDDIEPLPGMLAAHERAHRDLATPAAVLGPSHPVRRPGADWRTIAAWDWWDEQFVKMGRPGHRFRYDNVFSGNLSMPASLFAEVGGFDTDILCHHDYELGLRVIRSGGRVAFEPDAGGWHHESRDHAGFHERRIEEGRDDVALLQRHPDLWPVLAISHPIARTFTTKGVLLRLAFASPWLGDSVAGGLRPILQLFEYFRMRKAWNRTRTLLSHYGYWRGVASILGSRRSLSEVRHANTGARASDAREIEIDLRAGLAEAEDRLDRERPEGLWLRFGSLRIGHISPQPGAEPLRGTHLRPALAADMAAPLIAALEASAAIGDLRAWRPPVAALTAASVVVPAWNAAESFTGTAEPYSAGVEHWEGIVVNDGSTDDTAGVVDRFAERDRRIRLVRRACTEARHVFPIQVVDLEIGAGIQALDNPSGYGGAHILMRCRGRPHVWVSLFGKVARFDSEEILAALHVATSRRSPFLLRALALENQTEQKPPISVVICTRDRPDQLARCLRSLTLLPYPSYEVVVVDNAPTSDATRGAVTSAGVRYVCEPTPGLDWARNRGLSESRHDIVAYTDDDVEVDRRWLDGLAEGFADPHVQAVTGLVAPAALDTEAEVLFEFCYGGMGKGTLPRRWDPALLRPMGLVGTHHAGVGANMAFRRRILESLGGFDTALDVGTPSHGGGDLDMFHRILTAGGVIQYEPSALVRHHHRRDMAALEGQHKDNGRAFGVYLLKILRHGTAPRATTVRYAMRRWLPWLVRRVIRGWWGREPLPGSLTRAELVGALQAPWAYLATYGRDRRIRRRR